MERTAGQYGDQGQRESCHYCHWILCVRQSNAFQLLQPPPTTLGMGWWDKYQSWKIEPIRGRWEGSEANIKGKISSPKKRLGKKGQEPEPPRSSRGERLIERTRSTFVWIPWLNIVRWPRPSLSNPRSTNYIVWAFNVRTQYPFRIVTDWVLTIGTVCGKGLCIGTGGGSRKSLHHFQQPVVRGYVSKRQ